MARRRRLGVTWAAGCVVATIIALALIPLGRWDWPLFAMLFAWAALGERMTISIGGSKYTPNDLPIVLAAALLGPTPAFLCATLPAAVEMRQLLRRRQDLYFVAVLGGQVRALVLGVVLWLVRANGIEAGDAAYVPIVIVTALVAIGVNFMIVVLSTHADGTFSVEAAARTSFLPLLPWFAVDACLAATTAQTYAVAGIAGIVAVAVVTPAAYALTGRVAVGRGLTAAQAERSRYAAEAAGAEERERLRLAARLHDEVLQLVLAASQDLDEGSGSAQDARARLSEAIGVMRALMSGSLQAAYEELPLGQAIRSVTAAVGESTRCTVEVDPTLEHCREPTLQLAARELIVNVAKHARASELRVEVSRLAELAILEVADNGVGFDRSQTVAPDRGIGTALMDARVAAAGGQISYSSRPGNGTRVRVSLPLSGSSIRTG
jgi:signal transduction histidine kinase